MDLAQERGVEVEVEGLSRSYGGRQVLRDISLRIQAGEIFVIMGPSGSGKSVLLRHLMRLEQPDRGDIRLNGLSISDRSTLDLFRSTMVFQSSALLNSLTVGENVGIYLREHRLHPEARIREIVRERLEQVGLGSIENQYPSHLSGGMKKRVAIARALVIDPQLILFDEPTSELDPLMSNVITELIGQLNRSTGVTTLIVTHDRELALRLGSRLAIIRDGEILAVGNLREIYSQKEPFIQEFLMAGQPSLRTPSDLQEKEP